VTTEANALLRPLHDRMPVALSDAALDAWLDGRPHDRERLREALDPLAPELLEAFPVGRRVNRVGQDDPDILEPVGEPIARVGGWGARPAPGPTQDQLGLFGND
jgi:putative SOS response-associated peptidase YedK